MGIKDEWKALGITILIFLVFITLAIIDFNAFKVGFVCTLVITLPILLIYSVYRIILSILYDK